MDLLLVNLNCALPKWYTLKKENGSIQDHEHSKKSLYNERVLQINGECALDGPKKKLFEKGSIQHQNGLSVVTSLTL